MITTSIEKVIQVAEEEHEDEETKEAQTILKRLQDDRQAKTDWTMDLPKISYDVDDDEDDEDNDEAEMSNINIEVGENSSDEEDEKSTHPPSTK